MAKITSDVCVNPRRGSISTSVGARNRSMVVDDADVDVGIDGDVDVDVCVDAVVVTAIFVSFFGVVVIVGTASKASEREGGSFPPGKESSRRNVTSMFVGGQIVVPLP